jgi:hypothetical protein
MANGGQAIESLPSQISVSHCGLCCYP